MDLPPAHEQAFRQTMSCLPSGVSVVTLGGGDPVGVTISSLVSLSLEPLLVLFCLGKESKLHERFVTAATHQQPLGVTVLGQHQAAISHRFTRHLPENWQLTDLLPQETPEAPPLIAGGAAYMRCVCEETYPGGDHTLFLCRVTHCAGREEVSPLVYVHRGYGL